MHFHPKRAWACVIAVFFIASGTIVDFPAVAQTVAAENSVTTNDAASDPAAAGELDKVRQPSPPSKTKLDQAGEKLGRKVLIPKNPQFIGALGAALLASELEKP